MHKGDEAPVIVWDYDSRRDLYQLVGITEAATMANMKISVKLPDDPAGKKTYSISAASSDMF